MSAFFLRALDVLHFRGNQSFGDPGSYGQTQRLPWPSVASGALRSALLQQAGWQAAPEGVYLARERHVQALRRVDSHLAQASGWLQQQAHALDLLAEELRLAQNALNEITGEFSSDDLLGVIFSSFCIGK